MPAQVRSYRVAGRVQGVGFRWFVREQARAIGLAGTVRNETDGSVHVIARGTVGMLEQLERALRVGPGGSRVDAVDTLESVSADAGPTLPFPFAVDRGR